jgi:16S rRNA (cytosine967-C5)-methyltransferase
MKAPPPRFAGGRHTARSLALQVLLESHAKDAFVQEILDKHLTEAGLSAADRRLATQLTYGVLRRRGTLDALLRPLITRQPHQVEPWLWEALRLGAFQIALLTQIPRHAALFETVELAAAYQRPGAKGFLNGVLRQFAALVTEERVDRPAADALPLEQGQYRQLARPVLPDPAAHSVQYLAAAFALPRWLAERWQERFAWEECLRLGFWFAGPAPVWLRCNTLRTTRQALHEAFAHADILVEPGAHPQALRLAEPMAIRELPGYGQGWFTVQDESAMRVGSALAPPPGSRVLDLCAAPGGKTTHLAELMRNQGQIVACDVDDRRLQTLADLCQRLGVTIVEPRRLHPERNEEPPAGPFDAVLVDVPCSNTGVLGRRPEVRWRLRPEEFRYLARLQTKLLLQAAERIRPGGAIVYSTCSMEPEENRPVVQAVLQAMPDLVVEAEEEQVPGQPADGGYWARLRRKKL